MFVLQATTLFAPRQDIRLPSVAAHRKVNNDLRKALAHVTSDSVKSAAKSQHINTVMFEEDEKEDTGMSKSERFGPFHYIDTCKTLSD